LRRSCACSRVIRRSAWQLVKMFYRSHDSCKASVAAAGYPASSKEIHTILCVLHIACAHTPCKTFQVHVWQSTRESLVHRRLGFTMRVERDHDPSRSYGQRFKISTSSWRVLLFPCVAHGDRRCGTRSSLSHLRSLPMPIDNRYRLSGACKTGRDT
jgi:hypothetical protein